MDADNLSKKNLETVAARKPRWLALGLLLFFALSIRLALAPSMLNYDDRRDYVSAGHKAMRYGIGHYYDHASKADREYRGISGVPLPYPPVQIYCYMVAAYIYQTFFDASFAQVKDWREMPINFVSLNYLIKAPLFLFELCLAAIMFFWVRQKYDEKRALICAAAYAFNPAVLFDGSMWAQPDSLHCFFITLSLICLLKRQPVWCLVCLTLALLSKPQPTIFVPMILLLVLLTSTWKECLLSLLAAGVTALLILAPFLFVGISAIRDMLDVMSNVNRFASVNGHNLWWLVATRKGLNPAKTLDTEKVFANLSYFAISMILLSVFYIAVIGKTLTRIGKERLKSLLSLKNHPFFQRISEQPGNGFADWQFLCEAFAYLGFGFFIFSVRMHENHALQVLPLLLLTALKQRHQKVIFAVLSFTILANMILHTVEIVGEEPTYSVARMRNLNSGLNLLLFCYWSLSFLLQKKVVISHPEPHLADSSS